MPESQASTVDVDGILRRIQQEISRRAAGVDAVEAEAAPSGPAGYLPRLNVTPEDLRLRREYGVHEFMCFEDKQFVDNAYRTLLGRLGDPYYIEQLRSGRLSKIDVLGRIRYSAEGRGRGVRVRGLPLPFLLHTSFKVPVLGYVLESLYYLFRLPMVVQRQRLLEQQLAAARLQLAAQVNEALDDTEQAINRAGPH